METLETCETGVTALGISRTGASEDWGVGVHRVSKIRELGGDWSMKTATDTSIEFIDAIATSQRLGWLQKETKQTLLGAQELPSSEYILLAM